MLLKIFAMVSYVLEKIICVISIRTVYLPETYTTPSKRVGSGIGQTTLDDFVVDVFQDSTTSTYQFKTFNLH